MASITITGNLTKDAQLRSGKNGQDYVLLRIAENVNASKTRRRYRQQSQREVHRTGLLLQCLHQRANNDRYNQGSQKGERHSNHRPRQYQH